MENKCYIGETFNRLTILSYKEPRLYKRKNGVIEKIKRVECKCSCGRIVLVDLKSVIYGNTKSCGCSSRKLIFNKGINDCDDITYINGRDIKSYSVWHSMLGRCYSKKNLARYPTYKDCTVCDEWLYFSNFKKWFDENYIEGTQLDKDILAYGNKVYSPDTCCFVPSEINVLMSQIERFNNGIIGVHYDKINDKYKSVFRNKTLGRYNSKEEASLVYVKTKKRYIKEKIMHFLSIGKIDKCVSDKIIKKYCENE